MEPLTSFSSSGEDAITRSLEVSTSVTAPNPTNAEELAIVEELYEVKWTAEELLMGNYKQVALQFPDELLHISVPIFHSLQRRLSKEVKLYILADTSYGSCCVDEVAAQHINADVVVHYGYSCLSQPSHLPVIYVFTRAYLDVKHVADALLRLAYQDSSSAPASHLILIPDVAYAHYLDELCAELKASPLCPPDSQILYNPPRNVYPSDIQSSSLKPEESASYATTLTHSRSHRRYSLPPGVPLSSCTILYIGPESLGLTNLLMTHPENKIISYDPTNAECQARVESIRTNKLLMRRYAVVQRARDADVFGIIVGTLGVASYLSLLSNQRELIKRHKKKCYTLSIGKLNPAKLANFAEIECFVMIACPENSVIDSKEFYRPIVTPFELSLALNFEPTWPGNYILDFEHVIEETKSENSKAGEDEDRPLFSLVTGKYRHAKQYGEREVCPPGEEEGSTSIVLRNSEGSLSASHRAAADFLQTRTFKGLEQRLGQNAPSVLEEGRSGIAREYHDDHPTPRPDSSAAT